MIGRKGCYAIDPTRLVITARDLGYTGYDMENILKQRYNIKVEMADLFNVVAIVSIGDTEKEIDLLVSALRDFVRRWKGDVHKVRRISEKYRVLMSSFDVPQQLMIPHQAIFSPQKAIALGDSAGRISAELVVSYPPGIPLLLPGEKISREFIDYIKIGLSAGMKFDGSEDHFLKTIKVVIEYKFWSCKKGGEQNDEKMHNICSINRYHWSNRM